MSKQLQAQLEVGGYDASTAQEIVKMADAKADDAAAEFLEEVIGEPGTIQRYIRNRARAKPLSASRKPPPPATQGPPLLGQRSRHASPAPGLSPQPSPRPSPRPSSSTLNSRNASPAPPKGPSAIKLAQKNQQSNPQQPYQLPMLRPGASKPAPPPQPAPRPDKEFSTQYKIDSIKDLDAALKQLDLQASTRRKCTCMGAVHGLFELAPNCLNCGHIICNKEGMGLCLGCNAPVLENNTVEEIYDILRTQRDSIVSSMGKKALRAAGIDPTTVKKDSNVTENLSKAQTNLDRLLNYQATGAVRTKIIDQVSDFETPDMGTNQWASPLEQARQLREQQRHNRKVEELRKSKRGQGRKLISIDIKGNKVYQTVTDDLELSESEDEDTELKQEARGDGEEVRTEHKASAYFDTDSYGKNFVKPVYTEAKEAASQKVTTPKIGKKAQKLASKALISHDEDEVLAW